MFLWYSGKNKNAAGGFLRAAERVCVKNGEKQGSLWMKGGISWILVENRTGMSAAECVFSQEQVCVWEKILENIRGNVIMDRYKISKKAENERKRNRKRQNTKKK